MASVPVRFLFKTGVKRRLFRNVRLCGDWSSGPAAPPWAPTPMKDVVAEDNGPAFEATVPFPTEAVGRTFRWGVRADGPGGADQWLIMTEAQDMNSRDQLRTFVLAPAGARGPQTEVYYFSHARRLGAQKYYARPDDPNPELRFAVWAPNATKVETVIGALWKDGDGARRPLTDSVQFTQIHGGYVADAGTGSDPAYGPFPMDRQGDGVWVTRPGAAGPGPFKSMDHLRYMYRVTKDNGQVAYRTDLFSRCQVGGGTTDPGGKPYDGFTTDLDGTRSCSVIVDPDQVTGEKFIATSPERIWPELGFQTEEEFWRDEYDSARVVPRRIDLLVIYELHMGALGYGRTYPDGSPAPGTLDDALALLPYLVDLGVNAIELLPLSQFSGSGANWGYATSHYFAVEYSGGGRDVFKKFVRACHRLGLAVIMDVVYNHYVHQAERAQWMYDTDTHEKNCYYWYEGHVNDYPAYEQAAANQADPNRPAPGQGGYLDNLSTAYAPRYWEEMVRKMFISSAVALMEEFHVDGFRMDQTTSIHAYNQRHADGVPVGSANAFGAKLLRELNRTLKTVNPDVMLMAEDHSTWDAVTEPVDSGGLGFDARWFADFYHHLIGDTDKGSDYAKLLKVAGLGNNQPLAMDYFAGALGASGSKRVVYHKSHDEAGNGKFTQRNIVTAANGAPLVGSTRQYAEARCRWVCGVTLLSAGTPMFLFGEEVGFEKKFLYNAVLENREDLIAKRQGDGARLFRFYQEIIRLRLVNPGLRSRDIQVLHVHNANRVIAFRRTGGGQDFLVLASLNDQPFDGGYEVVHGAIPDGGWQEVFNSDAERFGGWNLGNLGAMIPSSGGRFNAVIPRIGLVVFQRI
jgi:1,4-alpha-glucan branching enzyme